jgi:GT2 family glycosyltransferase/SAM-dependent methyltransferase
VRTERCVVVIPTWDGAALLADCLDALLAQTLRPDHVIVVDNGSKDETLQLLARKYPWVDVVPLPTNTGFAYAVNCGIRASTERFIVLLNNDARPEPQWLEALVCAAMSDPASGFVTSRLLDESGTVVESTGDFIDWAGVPRQRDYSRPDVDVTDSATDVFSGCGGATLYRRAMLDDIGLFDERFFAYYEDVDLGFRAQLKGYSGTYVAGARVRHIGSATSNRRPGLKIRLSVRNNWWLVLKNAPLPILPRMLAGLAVANVGAGVHATRLGVLPTFLRGHVEAILGAPAVLKDRVRIQRGQTAAGADIGSKLLPADLSARALRKISRVTDRRTRSTRQDAVNPDSAIRYHAARRRLSASAGLILEVGAGTGGLTTYVDRPVIGLDRDFAQTADVRGGLITHVQGDAATLPFADGAFETVLSVDMLEHLAPSARCDAIREMVRVTRPGGVLLIAAPMGKAARRRDSWLASLWVRRFGVPNPWLSEHQELGLPERRRIEDVLKASDVQRWRVRGNALPPWWSLVHWLQANDVSGNRLNSLLVRMSPPAPTWWCYRLMYEICR